MDLYTRVISLNYPMVGFCMVFVYVCSAKGRRNMQQFKDVSLLVCFGIRKSSGENCNIDMKVIKQR